ncbi:TSUP family transporter [Natronoarchaeum sp. GCM10025703]|uniref:TSUP family transporter n=1 Tax=Natronoarchaeum sp. GCM10025703 TaxID=3252685 RepID=UPI003623D4BB
MPEITTTQLIVRCRLPPRVAIATSVFVLGVAAIAGAVVHALSATPVWYVVAWSIPGVLVGGTIGTRVSKYVPSEVMEPVLGVVFAVVGVVVLATEFVACGDLGAVSNASCVNSVHARPTIIRRGSVLVIVHGKQ